MDDDKSFLYYGYSSSDIKFSLLYVYHNVPRNIYMVLSLGGSKTH
jgi:hypothetical protein